VEVGGIAYETLLDTGAATSVISEETLCGIINTTRGAEPPVVMALEEWGVVEEATGVAKEAPLRIVGSVVLYLTLRGIDHQVQQAPFRFKIFAEGSCAWRGLIIGGPALEQAPAGVGYRPSLAGHVFEKLGIVLPRLEEQAVLDRVDTYAFLGLPSIFEADSGATLRDLACTSEGAEPFLEPVGAKEGSLAVLDGAAVELQMGECAWLPVAVRPGAGEAVHGE